MKEAKQTSSKRAAASKQTARPARKQPMRGAALSWLASAFRLRQTILLDAGVAEGTAKQGLGDQRDIGRHQHVALLRKLVDELFKPEYLQVRGLTPTEATKHNDLVAQSLEVILACWDQRATLVNADPARCEQIEPMLGLVTKFDTELALRLAAYEAQYGFRHSCLAHVGAWLREPKLKGWWATVEARAAKPIKVSLFGGQGRLDSHTVRDRRDGKASPRESNVAETAERLAAHGIRDAEGAGRLGAAEIEFELRLAIALAENRELVKRLLRPQPQDALANRLHLYRMVLRQTPDLVVEELLERGTQARAWPVMARAIQDSIRRNLAELRLVPRVQATSAPPGELELCHAAQLRNYYGRPGADGPEKRVAEQLEHTAAVLIAQASTPPQSPPQLRAGLEAQLRADALCLQANTPWSPVTEQERERLFREAVGVCDTSAYAHRSLGAQLSHVGKLDEAIVHLRRSIEFNPANEEGREILAGILVDRGEHQGVLALSEGRVESAMLRALRAHALFEVGDTGAARKLADAVLVEQPGQTVALRVLAECERRGGNAPKAGELVRQAELRERGVG